MKIKQIMPAPPNLMVAFYHRHLDPDVSKIPDDDESDERIIAFGLSESGLKIVPLVLGMKGILEPIPDNDDWILDVYFSE